MAKIRVLVADDHAVLRSGLKLLINSQADMQVVGEAGSHHAVLAQHVRPLAGCDQIPLERAHERVDADPLLRILTGVEPGHVAAVELRLAVHALSLIHISEPTRPY